MGVNEKWHIYIFTLSLVFSWGQNIVYYLKNWVKIEALGISAYFKNQRVMDK